MFKPKGYYTGNSYVGFLPGGSRMSFPTQSESAEDIQDWNLGEAASMEVIM